ncbi:MAG: hypothetical protein WC282_05010, partial [Bacilli bacterium]
MYIAKSKLVIDHALTVEKNFEFPHENFPFVKPLLSIKKCYGILKITKSQRLIRMDIDLSITAILECSYSLEPFAHELEIHEGMLISDSTSFDEEAISIKGDEINVEEILYALISSSLPLKPVKP